MEAMIFAAGLGTRLQPLTNNKPKALVEVAGKPLLEHCIEKLIQSHCTKIVVNIHHFGEQIIDFLGSKKFDVEIIISDERNLLLDTGGGLKNAAKAFSGKKPVLVHNVDVFSNIDLQQLYNIHQHGNALATLAVASRNTSRYLLFDKKDNLVGWKNQKTGETLWANPTAEHSAVPLAFSGIHVVSPEIFELLPDIDPYPIVPQYVHLATNHTIKAFEHTAEQWIDVGKPDTITLAQEFIEKHIDKQ